MDEMHKFVEENFDRTVSALKLFYTDSDWRWLVNDKEEMRYVVTAFINQVFLSVCQCTVDGKSCLEIAKENIDKYFASYLRHAPEASKVAYATYGSLERMKRENTLDAGMASTLCWGAIADEVEVYLEKWHDNGCSAVRKQGNFKD